MGFFCPSPRQGSLGALESESTVSSRRAIPPNWLLSSIHCVWNIWSGDSVETGPVQMLKGPVEAESIVFKKSLDASSVAPGEDSGMSG